MPNMTGDQKREHFRIVYPLGHTARLLIKKAEFKVLDISQKGIRFSIDSSTDINQWEIGLTVKASVTFMHGERTLVEGKVLRTIDLHSVVLLLKDPIDLKVMYDEHRYVINKFGGD